ncbi:MAG: hypothetical protein ACE367_19580 [Acidimicrobiales bacterium]
MLRPPDPRRVERLLGDDGDSVVALVPVTPQDALPDTVGAVVARSVGLGRRTVAPDERWDDASGAFVAPASPVDLRARRQVLLALTAPSERLVVIGLDRLGRPAEVVWWTRVADLERVTVEPARLLGLATEALVVAVPEGLFRFVLARPDRRSGHELAARLRSGVRYSDG